MVREEATMHKSDSLCPRCSGQVVRTISQNAYSLKTGEPCASQSNLSAHEVMCDKCYTIFDAPANISYEEPVAVPESYIVSTVADQIAGLRELLSCDPPRDKQHIRVHCEREIAEFMGRIQSKLPEYLSDGLEQVMRSNIETYPYFNGIIPEFDEWTQYALSMPANYGDVSVTYYDKDATYE